VLTIRIIINAQKSRLRMHKMFLLNLEIQNIVTHLVTAKSYISG